MPSLPSSPRLVAVTALLGPMICGLAACDLGPDYTPPTLEIPPAYRATADTAKAAWPSADWWKGFGSPDLDHLIADARDYNFDIQAAIARVREADAQVRISGAPLLPSASAGATQSWQHASAARRGGGTGYVETRSYSLEPTISYEVDLWGRVRAQQASAEASALYSRFDQETIALTTTTSVANTWFQALAYQDRLDVLAHNISDAEEILKAIRARLDAGTASALDVSQQASLVDGLHAEVPGLRSSLEQQLIGLGILTGHPPEAITARPGTLNTLKLPELSPGLPSALLERRPDVQSAEAQLRAQNANIQAARANFFPVLSLTGSGGWENTALSTLFGPGAIVASVTSSLTQTVFDNGLKGGQYEQAKASYDELLADYRKAVVQAFTDVDNALVAYRYATEQEALQAQAVRSAQLAADIARAQVLAGTSDIVTALQTQTTLFSDQDTLVQVRLARFQALLNLYKALGGGWTKSDVAVPPSTVYHGIL